MSSFMFMSGLGRNSGRRVVLFILFVFERGEIWWNLIVDISMFRGTYLVYTHASHLQGLQKQNTAKMAWSQYLFVYTLSISIYLYMYTLPRLTSSRLFSEMCFLCGFILGFRLYAMLVVKVSIWRHPEDQVFYFEELLDGSRNVSYLELDERWSNSSRWKWMITIQTNHSKFNLISLFQNSTSPRSNLPYPYADLVTPGFNRSITHTLVGAWEV